MFEDLQEAVMFPTTLDDYHTQAKELYRRAEEYRLIKSLEKPIERGRMIAESLGRTLIDLGEQLIQNAQAAH